jgi:hypothetical protein
MLVFQLLAERLSDSLVIVFCPVLMLRMRELPGFVFSVTI